MAVTPNYDLDIDSTLGGDNASDYVIPSQKAIKSYVDNNTGSTVDQVYDPTSQSAQSGIAIAGANFLTSSDLTDYVTTNTDQNITGVKTFVGQKMIAFKQASSSNKLGFTLYNNNNVEKGYLEFNPTNTIDGAPLMTLGNYATAASGITHVGFRKYSSVSGASGAYNLLAPLISNARTPFNLTTTYTNFYLPLGFTNGTTTVTTAKSGLVDISSLFPSTPNLGDLGNVTITSPTQGQNLTYDATNNVWKNTSTSATVAWGGITGTLTDQTDLNTALSNKQDTSTAVTHTASTAVGDSTTPVYVDSSGVATACTYSLGKSVPSNAVFTDTTYSDFTGATSITGGASGLVPAPSSGDNDKILTGSATWSSLKTINSTSLLGSGDIAVADNTLSNVSSIDNSSAVKTALDNKVSITGDTMTGGLCVETSTPAIDLRDTVEVAGTTPSLERLKAVIFRDKNNKAVGRVQNIYLTTGARRTMLNCTDATGSNSENIYIGYDSNGNIETYAPTPSNGDNSTKIATTAFVNTVSANKVDKAGDTMTGDLIISEGSPTISLDNTSLTKGSIPSGNCYTEILFNDGSNNSAWANKRLAILGYAANSDGGVSLTMRTYKREVGTTTGSALAVGYDANGNAYATAPTPVSTSNGTNIATTAFCDGNWTKVDRQVMSAVSLDYASNYNISLSNILPNDGNLYEVMITGNVTTGSTVGNFARIYINMPDLNTYVMLCFTRTRTSSTMEAAGSAIITAKSTSTISIVRESGTNLKGTANLWILAYRKVR